MATNNDVKSTMKEKVIWAIVSAFTVVFVGLSAMVIFDQGYHLGQQKIVKSCQSINAFYINNEVYVCKRVN